MFRNIPDARTRERHDSEAKYFHRTKPISLHTRDTNHEADRGRTSDFTLGAVSLHEKRILVCAARFSSGTRSCQRNEGLKQGLFDIVQRYLHSISNEKQKIFQKSSDKEPRRLHFSSELHAYSLACHALLHALCVFCFCFVLFF